MFPGNTIDCAVNQLTKAFHFTAYTTIYNIILLPHFIIATVDNAQLEWQTASKQQFNCI